MEDIEKLVQEVTDVIIQCLQNEEPGKTVKFLGKEYSSIRAYYKKRGYEIIQVNGKIDIDIVVVTELSIVNMNRIALGLPQTEYEEIIFQSLLNKKEVIFLEEGMEIQAKQRTAPRAMLQILENHKNQLVRFGASIFPLKNFENPNNANLKEVINKRDKKELLTIAKVRKLNLQAGDIFEADKNMIVTALARDYMRDLGVQIV